MPANYALEPLVSLADAAQLTGESLAVWRKRILHRQIDFVKCGRNVRLHPAALKGWLDRRIVPAGRESDNLQ